MSETTPTQATGASGASGAQVQIVAQYVRDISFENPGAPNFRPPETERPEVQVSINVDIRDAGPNQQEVGLKVNATLAHNDTKYFVCEVDYAALIHMENIPEDNKRRILLVEIPRFIFPFMRKVLHDTTREGGWQGFMLEPIDFAQLYRAEQEQRAQQEAGGDAPAAEVESKK